MTSGTLGAHSAARLSILPSTRAKLALGMLLSSVATAAVAQSSGAVVPGSTNTTQQEQTTAPNAPGTLPPAPQADDVAQPASGATVVENAPQAPQDQGLGAIIVTATKRETNLQRTPIAISVVNTQSLADRHAQSLGDLGDGAIPSLRVATFESRQTALTVGIRGIVPFDANQTARDQGVGVYVDGIYVGRQQGLNAALLDIDRIEVLRGPQGTLFGRNTEGGAVSIITRAPTGAFGLRATAGAGNYGSYNTTAHLDLPAFGNIALKFDGLIQHQDATTRNPLEGELGWNYRHTVGGRAAARWTPNSDLTVDIAYDRTRDESTPNYSQLVNYNPNGYNVGTYVGTSLRFNGTPCNVVVAGVTTNPCIAPLSPIVQVTGGDRQTAAEIGVPQQESVARTQGVTGTVKYNVTGNLQLRSISGWRKVSADQWDNSGGAHRSTFVPNANFSRYSLSQLDQDQFSQEFQAVGNLPSLDYVLGLYYFQEKVRERAATPSTNRWNATGTGFTINDPLTWQPRNWSVSRDSNAKAKSYAVFGQATYTPAGLDTLHITGGARYTHDKRDGALTVFQNAPVNFPFRYRKGRIDPMVTVAFDAAPTINLYAKYATGFRAGGANSRSQTFRSFGPETVQSFELGSKMDFFDRRARLNLAAYIMRRKGTQTDFDFVDTRRFLDPANTISNPNYNRHYEETVNAPGTSKIKGFEADLTVRPLRALTLGASYSFTDVKVPATPDPFVPGNPLFQVYTVFTPKHAASGYVDYEIPTGFAESKVRFHLDANYAGRQYSFQAEPVKTDASFVVNGRIALADVAVNEGSTLLTFALWSRNLFNEAHIYRRSAANSFPIVNADGSLSFSGILGDYANFPPPRTWGAEIAVKIGAPRRVEPYVAPPAPPPLPATVTCESGVVVAAPGACPPPAAPLPPPPPAPAPERGQ